MHRQGRLQMGTGRVGALDDPRGVVQDVTQMPTKFEFDVILVGSAFEASRIDTSGWVARWKSMTSPERS